MSGPRAAVDAYVGGAAVLARRDLGGERAVAVARWEDRPPEPAGVEVDGLTFDDLFAELTAGGAP